MKKVRPPEGDLTLFRATEIRPPVLDIVSRTSGPPTAPLGASYASSSPARTGASGSNLGCPYKNKEAVQKDGLFIFGQPRFEPGTPASTDAIPQTSRHDTFRKIFWSGNRDSNPGPLVPQTSTLTNCAIARPKNLVLMSWRANQLRYCPLHVSVHFYDSTLAEGVSTKRLETGCRIEVRADPGTGHAEVVTDGVVRADGAERGAGFAGCLEVGAPPGDQAEASASGRHMGIQRNNKAGRVGVPPGAGVDGVPSHHPAKVQKDAFCCRTTSGVRKQVRPPGRGPSAAG